MPIMKNRKKRYCINFYDLECVYITCRCVNAYNMFHCRIIAYSLMYEIFESEKVFVSIVYIGGSSSI